VGWYPTSVRVTPDGKRLLVANGKGLISHPNRNGPQPGRDAPATVREYIGGLMQGTLSVIDLAAGDKFTEQMQKHTAQMYRCLPPIAAPPSLATPRNPVPVVPGAPTPIKYCLYVIKENRTYDQILGDMPEGNGDPSLCLFPERITPNHHALAREFVLLDNFYVESEVSADGHEWTMGAYATDFVEKTWPLSYGHNKHKKYPYPSEGNFDLATPAGGYLWDRAKEAGVSYRSYGEFVRNGKTTNAPGTTRIAALKDHFDPWFRSFDQDYSDQWRADRYIAELKRFEQEGDMPRLQIIRLPNDHTSGTTLGKHTPTAAVADNDLALGRIVEAVSRTKFWAQTAIFVIEDDAQNGPDHVDAHRTIAYAISPYSRRGSVDSTMYSTASMLRTIELILGLKPMSQFDAMAQPMFNSFQAKPDLRPYVARAANVDLNERNLKTAWGSKESSKMDFTKEDAADDLILNEIIWRSVRGADSKMPAPVRAAFVFTNKGDDDDDD
jgi:phospholipase C